MILGAVHGSNGDAGMVRPDNVPERADDPLLGTSSLLPAIPPAWREVIQGLRDTLVYAEEEIGRAHV